MSQKRQFKHPLLRKWTAVFFALVMVGFGLAQAMHVHDAGTTQTSPASHCSLCVAAHHAAVITSISSAPVPVIEAAALETPELQLDSRLQVGATYIRPPPQSL